MPHIHGERFRRCLASLGLVALGVSGCDQAIQPPAARGREEPESLASGDRAEEKPDLHLVISPAVSVPLDGLAEIDVTVQGEEPRENLEITADASEPGLVTVPGVVHRFTRLGTIRVGARAPLAVGATFTLRVTARSHTGVSTTVSNATVVDKAGSLDPSFGGTGTFVASASKYDQDGFFDLHVDPDGSVLGAGPHTSMSSTSFRVVHVREDGSADPAFGDPRSILHDGSAGVRFPDNSKNAIAFALRRQSTGHIVVAGVDRKGGADRIALAGLLPNGVYDPSFGEDGVRLFAPDRDAAAFAMALALDDSLVIAGRQGRHALVARLTPDGAPDPRFAHGGYAIFDPVDGAVSEVHGVAVDGAGRVLAAGNAGSHAFVTRFSPDGSEDQRFRWRVVLPTPDPVDEATAQAIALSPDGAILIGGTVRRCGAWSVAVWRVRENGEIGAEPGHGFGEGGLPGLAAVPVSAVENPMGGFTLLPDGRSVLAVNVDRRAGYDREHAKPFLLRLLADGTIDPLFGSRGFVRVPLGQGDVVLAIDHTGDGKLVLGLRLRSGPNGGEPAAIARVWD